METINKRTSVLQQLNSGVYENEFTIDYLIEMKLGYRIKEDHFLGKKMSIPKKFRDVVREIENYSMDLASDHNHRVVIGLSIASKYGKKARNLYHRICKINEDYDKELCNKEFTKYLENTTSVFSIDIVHTLVHRAYIKGVRPFNNQNKKSSNY